MSRILWLIRLRPPLYPTLNMEHLEWHPQRRSRFHLTFSAAARASEKRHVIRVSHSVGHDGNTASTGQRLQKTMVV